MSRLQEILRDTNHSSFLFNERELAALERRIFLEDEHFYVECLIRKKKIRLKPEEIVRQLYLARLIRDYGYPESRIQVEAPVQIGSTVTRADIVVFNKERTDTVYIIAEIKRPKLKDGKKQLRSYCNATGAPISVWTNGAQISYYHRKPPNYFEPITDLPKAGQKLADILKERFTIKDLIMKDKLTNERKSLKDIILDMEDDVLANAGVDVFEEAFKLIFTKLYDEFLSRNDRIIIDHAIRRGEEINDIPDEGFRVMEFRNSGQTQSELKAKIGRLFNQAKDQWKGVFSAGDTFALADSHLSLCVASLQNIKLFNSNLQIVDEAFEYLVSKTSKGEKGQYFTPRHVIDMCVNMLNPQRGEYMIDTASGSCGFPVHTIFKIVGENFNSADALHKCREDILRIFGIDFDEKTVRVARTLNLIAGDGESNVLCLNALDYKRWHDSTSKDKDWINTYGNSFERLERLRAVEGENHRFNFDIVMANPPFAGDIKEGPIISQFQLGVNPNHKIKSKIGRDVLFIERNLNFLKAGGRMAIVLPQGRFSNTSDKYIRDFIAEHGRILAVVSLHHNTFRPHTSTKTSVLFIQKWHDKLCPKVDDYPIFFAVSEKGGKDNSGDYIYVKDDKGEYKQDKHGNLVIAHDLYSYDYGAPEGIAEAFIEWAKREKLKFWS